MFPSPFNYSSWQAWADALVTELEFDKSLEIEALVGQSVITPGTFNGNETRSFVVSVPRARQGMFTLASFSLPTGNTKLLSVVSADDEVTVAFTHQGGMAPDVIAQGILRVRVLPLRAGE